MHSRLVSLLALTLVAGGTSLAAPSSAGAATAPVPPAARTSSSEPRGEQFPATVTRTDLRIPMDDGVVLRGDLTLPADADGTPAHRRFPVVVTITAYNKQAVGGAGGLAGPGPASR